MDAKKKIEDVSCVLLICEECYNVIYRYHIGSLHIKCWIKNKLRGYSYNDYLDALKKINNAKLPGELIKLTRKEWKAWLNQRKFQD